MGKFAILVLTVFQPKLYQEICTKSLIFDDVLIKNFHEESNKNRKRYVCLIILGILLLFFGPEFLLIVRDVIGREIYNALIWLMDAFSVALFIIAGISIHSENISAQNARYRKKKNR